MSLKILFCDPKWRNYHVSCAPVRINVPFTFSVPESQSKRNHNGFGSFNYLFFFFFWASRFFKFRYEYDSRATFAHALNFLQYSFAIFENETWKIRFIGLLQIPLFLRSILSHRLNRE